jgi:hypothetical protein
VYLHNNREKSKKPKEMTKKSQIDTRVQSGLLPNKPNALGRCRRCLIPHERDNLFGCLALFFIFSFEAELAPVFFSNAQVALV